MQSRHHNRGAPGSTPYRHPASITGSEYESDSSLGVEVPPESPMVSEADFVYTVEENYGIPRIQEPGTIVIPLSRPPAPVPKQVKQPTHPDALIREEVFNQLAFCGFLDVRQASLFRWAVGVVWSMHMYRQTHCSSKHRSFIPRSNPPPILYRLFAANAILPNHIRESATTRVLIVLHALYYMSRVPSCAVCASRAKADELDLSAEDLNAFAGVEEGVVSRMVIEWSVGIRCAVAWLVDEPERNYWEIHTRHIPDKVGASVTRTFQKCLDYKLAIPNDKLIKIMHAITDDHPISLTPTSRRRYCPPPGLHGLTNWNGLISTQ